MNELVSERRARLVKGQLVVLLANYSTAVFGEIGVCLEVRGLNGERRYDVLFEHGTKMTLSDEQAWLLLRPSACHARVVEDRVMSATLFDVNIGGPGFQGRAHTDTRSVQTPLADV